MIEDDKLKAYVRVFLPHALFFLLLLLSAFFLVWILRPVLVSLLAAAAICILTYPVICAPLMRLFGPPPGRPGSFALRQFLALLSTIILAGALVSPILLLVYNATGSLGRTAENIVALALGRKGACDNLLGYINSQFVQMQEFFPRVPIDIFRMQLQEYLQNTIGSMDQLAPSVMRFLFKGTGSLLLQVSLTVIGINFFFANGPEMVRALLGKTSLGGDDMDELFNIHRKMVLRLLSDTLATSLAKGLLMGLIIHLFTGFDFLLIALLATFVSLLPLIGSAIVWLPMASLLWTQHSALSAIALVLCCILSMLAVDYIRRRLGDRLHETSNVVNFFIFMGVIGGVMALGLGGVIIGPVCVILANELGTFWLAKYHLDRDPQCPGA